MIQVSLLFFLFVAIFAATAQYTQLTVGFWKANSHCSTDLKPPAANVTYTLKKCYGGVMYDCDYTGQHVSYMLFGEPNCVNKYPDSYGLPGEYCMSPVYAYSQYDSYMWCH